MALAATMVWEVRADGNDANGGAFKAGASGTDYSQAAAPITTQTDLAVDGSDNTKVTSAGRPFVAADIGNVIIITNGGAWTGGHYEITAVVANVATLDRSPAATNSTSGTFKLGGAKASLGGVGVGMVGQNKVWVKAGAYTVSTATANNNGGPITVPAGAATAPSQIEGYSSFRGDKGTRPVFTLGAISTLDMIKLNADHSIVDNIEIDCSARSAAIGVNVTGNFARVRNCVVKNSVAGGFATATATNVTLIKCRATACATTSAFNLAATTHCIGCVAHDNTITGFTTATGVGSSFIRCIAYNNSGASTDGFSLGISSTAHGCIAYNNERHGFNSTAANVIQLLFNCIAVKNGTTGFNMQNNHSNLVVNCAHFSNPTAGYAGNTTFGVEGLVALSQDPFVNGAAGDFNLNSLAGGGALCKGVGYPGKLPGINTFAYPDLGAAAKSLQEPAVRLTKPQLGTGYDAQGNIVNRVFAPIADGVS